MPKCPKCGKEIDCLRNFQSGENAYDFYVEDGDTHYELDEFQPDNNINDYECPECSETLFTDEEEARKFLLGE